MEFNHAFVHEYGTTTGTTLESTAAPRYTLFVTCVLFLHGQLLFFCVFSEKRCLFAVDAKKIDVLCLPQFIHEAQSDGFH